jgi:hypothetical protein
MCVTPTVAEAERQRFDLAGRQQLVLEQQPTQTVLRLLAPDGQVTLAVHVTPAGPVLHFGGAGLLIQADGDLAVNAGRLALHGRDGVVLSSGGDARIRIAGDLETCARIQTITAERGNVNVKANDDVRLDGERVLVNCEQD